MFRLLQKFLHQQNKPDLLNYSRSIDYPDNEVCNNTAFVDIENAASYGKRLGLSAW